MVISVKLVISVISAKKFEKVLVKLQQTTPKTFEKLPMHLNTPYVVGGVQMHGVFQNWFQDYFIRQKEAPHLRNIPPPLWGGGIFLNSHVYNHPPEGGWL